jgi:hypothetical protein
MNKLSDLYTDFFRIDLDTRGGYSRVASVVTHKQHNPQRCAFKLMRHEIDWQKGMERFQSELKLLSTSAHDRSAPSAVPRIYDSGFAPMELSHALDQTEIPDPHLEINQTGLDFENFVGMEKTLQAKEPGKWLPYLVLELAPYDDSLLRQIRSQSVTDSLNPDKLHVNTTIEMALQLLDPMQYLHVKHHRAYMDWKPEHVFWDNKNKQVKLVDWNITMDLDDGPGEKQNIRDDIRLFCGAVLYAGLALVDPGDPQTDIGLRPTVELNNPLPLNHRKYLTDKPNFYNRDALLDEKIKQIVQRGLDPNQGYDTVQELRAVLTEYLEKNIGETDVEKATRLQAAISANLLINNRSQAMFNDRAQGEDQLGIKDEVEALAETLLLRDVEPPLAVGIMGGWGSGKSFVMYLISKYIEKTRAKSVKKGWSIQDKDPDVPAYVGHIYQINFNAWTYAKSNLWASLMDTIFISLNRQMQIEQLLAHRDCSSKDTISLAEDVYKSMLAGGEVFTKIYGENLKFDQDSDLKQWRENLDYWAHHLFKGNLLWMVMRRRQEENIDRLKDTEEQLKQLKSGREQFEKSCSPEQKSIELNASSKKAYIQTMKTVMMAFIADALSHKAKEKLKEQGLTEEDIQKSRAEATGLLGAVNAIITAFRKNHSYWFLTLLFLLLTFALPYLGTKLRLDFLTSVISQATSLLIAAIPVITSLASWAQKVINFNKKAKTILEDAYKNQQAKQAEEIANSMKMSPAQKIAELQDEISQGSLAAYDTLINLLEAQAEAERQLIGPSAKYSSLMEFVQSRLDAATYENQLGLMHQVRQDIDELTYSLADGAREDVFPRGKPRVILYIDDLDRCPPSRVVEVLEAVQLLLNTKLFVIILGLDTRYITRALEKEYKEILQHEGDPSGLDYIEKIIQIPYRVRPIERDSLQKYLAMQMDVEKPPELEIQPAQQVQSQPVTNISSASTPLSKNTQPKTTQAMLTDDTLKKPLSGDAPKGTSVPDTIVEPKISKPKPLEIELPPAVIQFKQDDLADLTACCQQILLSPRSIKRLVNVLKLMKIFWFRARKDADIAGRDETRPVKQAAICLLALSSAYPEIMREVFVHLENLYRRGQEQIQLFMVLNTISLPPGSAHELAWQFQKYKSDVDALKTIVVDGQDKYGQITLQDLGFSTFNLVRSFSFVGDPVYWADDEDGKPIVVHQPARRISKVNPN